MLFIPHGSVVAKKNPDAPAPPIYEFTQSYASKASVALGSMAGLAIMGLAVVVFLPQLAATVFKLSWVVFLLASAVFIAWLFRAYRNLASFNIEGLQFAPRWAVLGYILPVANAFVPKQLVDDLWCASYAAPKSPGGAPHWQHLRAPSWLGAWWGAQLAFVYLLPMLSIAAPIFSQFAAGLACLALGVTGGLGVRLIREVEARQSARFSENGAIDKTDRERATCPLCKAPLRSVRAKQCPSCLLDWHDFDKLKFLGSPRTSHGRASSTSSVAGNPSNRSQQLVTPQREKA